MADQSRTNPTTYPAFTPTPSNAQFRATAVAGKASSASVACEARVKERPR